ncbi:MAG: pyruvate dehydrogenase (acetyl-transferring) E1 component subunit alpha [bacterium]|nr:pyruvate dehydrogenase (acetyl-transferring) E1 component subunit alpha [bacterium]
MLRVRRLEERCTQLYGQGKIAGFCHLYIGQEAVAAGALACTRQDDYVITTYRDHGMALLRGIAPESIFGELMGREIGCSKGRGGSMHLFSKQTHFLGGHGIVGAHIPLGTGAAFAAKYRGEDRVTLCFFGEGAVNNGAFHESLNLAALWKLPIVYICENNRYGMGTPVERASSIYDLHRKAEGYDMDHAQIDGMEVERVFEEVGRAIKAARHDKPSFLEIRTYRFRGHSMSDPIHSHYRTKAEVEEQKERDPIKLWRESLVTREVVGDDEIKAMDKEIMEEMKAALAKAEASPEPPAETVGDYVWAE